MKTYRVKEVREYTGLSRKQLYDYEKSIPPVAKENESGYKLYDQEGLDRLSMAALFSELGAGPQRINDIFGAEDYDKRKVLVDLIDEAKRERQRLNDIITVASFLRNFDIKSISYNPFQISELHKMAESIRSDYKSADVTRIINNLDVKKKKKLLRILKGFEAFDENNAEAEGIDKQVEKVIAFIRKDLEVENWARILTGYAITLGNAEKYKNYVDKRTREGMAEYISEAIASYQMNKMIDEGEKYWDELEAIEGNDFEDPAVQKAVERIMKLLNKWYGFKSLTEASGIFQSLQYMVQQDEESDEDIRKVFSTLFEVVKYYEEKEHYA